MRGKRSKNNVTRCSHVIGYGLREGSFSGGKIPSPSRCLFSMTVTATVPGAPAPACTVAGGAPAPTSAPPVARPLFRHVRFENLVAGMSGGVVSTLVLHPLDLVKIRFAG